MSKWKTQVTYNCECEEPYGSVCNKQSRFILEYNCSTDSTRIFHKRHIQDPFSRYERYNLPEYLSDNESEALRDLLNLSTGEGEEIDTHGFWEDIYKKENE
jgi:hypothetical protein